MPDIVVSEFMDPKALASLERDFSVVFDPELWQDSESLGAALLDARALIVRNRTQVTADLLERGANLKVIGRLGVGLDNIDVSACRARNIEVCPATGANTVSVAEYTIAAILMLLRPAYFKSHEVASGAWPRQASIGSDAAGRRLGLVGFGAIAQAVAERAASLAMTVIAYDPYLPETDPAWRKVEKVGFQKLLEASDFVSVHTPLTEETLGLIGESAIAKMRPGAYVINTARGGIVDENAIVAALKSGHLGGAALDVFDVEPVSARSGARFADTPNLILTPHISGVTQESNQRASALTAANVRKVLMENR